MFQFPVPYYNSTAANNNFNQMRNVSLTLATSSPWRSALLKAANALFIAAAVGVVPPLNGILSILDCRDALSYSLQVKWIQSIIGKKVEASLRLLDIFKRNRVFILLKGKLGISSSWLSPQIDRVSKFDNSLSFGAMQNALQQIFFAL